MNDKDKYIRDLEERIELLELLCASSQSKSDEPLPINLSKSIKEIRYRIDITSDYDKDPRLVQWEIENAKRSIIKKIEETLHFKIELLDTLYGMYIDVSV